MARCMLHEKELPKNLCVEAASTVVFLLNRLPTGLVHGRTPLEAWFSCKRDLQNLKSFSCLSFSYVPQVKRDKLERRQNQIFLLDIAALQSLQNFPTIKWENYCKSRFQVYGR